MKQSRKVAAAILVVCLLAGGALLLQKSSSSVKPIRLSAHDMEMFVSELLPPSQQQQIASSPEEKKNFIKDLKRLFGLAQTAEREGYLQLPQVQAQVQLQTDLELKEAYSKKHPGVQVSDEELANYYRQNPNAFESFLQGNPQYQAQAQGPQRDAFKKEYGQVKVLADRGRKEGLDRDELTKLRLLVKTSQVLASSYASDLNKKTESEVSDVDINQYYQDHPDEFVEVRARHILVSTQSDQAGDDESAKKGPDKKAKPLTKEEARRKAQSILDRVRKGEDFAKLAQELSDDPGSKLKGGDLGYFTRGQNVRPFEEVAYSLSPGQVSDLVETDFGLHIIKVEDRRIAPLDTKTQQTISNKLKRDRLEKVLDRIAETSDVRIAEDFDVNPNPASAPLS